MSTLAVAIPARANADRARNVAPSWANDRPPSPITSATRETAIARCRPAARAKRGASAPNTANASTGSEVSRPASGPDRSRPRRTSSSTGPTLTAAGRRLNDRRMSPTSTRAVRRAAGTAGSCHPRRRLVTSASGGLSAAPGRMRPMGEVARHVDDAERRARLGLRHALAVPVADTLAAARSVVCLHAPEPASVHLAAWARSGASLADVDRALYDERSVVKQLAMRRTVFAFPRELLPAVWGSASARVAGQQERRMAAELQSTGLATDGLAWTREHLALVRRMIEDDGPLTAAEVREALPALDARVTRGKGRYQADVALAGSVIVTLAASGAIVRGTNAGGWKTSRPRWTATGQWLGEVPDPLPEPEGYAALVAAWLRAFGPGTEADLVWWLGSTKAAVRRALADVAAVAASLDGGETGWLLPDDLDAVPDPGHWAALLPALDPTTMGWKQRDFHLGEHTDKVFDRNGNGGPTAWCDGRIVGVGSRRDDGRVEVALAEEVPRAGQRALERRAAELTDWLAGDVVRSIYLSPLARERLALSR